MLLLAFWVLLCIHVPLCESHIGGSRVAKSAKMWRDIVGKKKNLLQHTSDEKAQSDRKRLQVHSGAGGYPGSVSVNVNMAVNIGSTQEGSTQEGSDFFLLSVDRLLPAREHLHHAFNCYDKDGNHTVHGEIEMQDLQRHVATLVSSDDVARQLIADADFRNNGGLDEVEFGTLLDLICWKLNIKICATLQSGRHFSCQGMGTGSLGMFGSFEKLADAHADLDISFQCFDRDGNGKLDEKETKELLEHLKTGLHFSDEMLAEALEESDWGQDGYCELQFDCLLMMLQNAVDKIDLNVGPE